MKINRSQLRTAVAAVLLIALFAVLAPSGGQPATDTVADQIIAPYGLSGPSSELVRLGSPGSSVKCDATLPAAGFADRGFDHETAYVSEQAEDPSCVLAMVVEGGPSALADSWGTHFDGNYPV